VVGEKSASKLSIAATTAAWSAHAIIVLLVGAGPAQGADTNSIEQLVRAGSRELAARHWGAAADLFRRVLREEPENVRANEGMARALYQSGEFSEAIPALKKVLAADPDRSDVHFPLGYCYYALKDYPRAAESLQRFISTNPTNAEAHFWLSRSLVPLRRYVEAEEAAARAVALGAATASHYGQMGYCLERLRRYREAIEACKKALSQNSNYTYARLLLGICYYRTRAFTEAIVPLEMYVTAEPKDFDGLWYLAHAHFRLFHFERAAQACEKALELRPNAREMRRDLVFAYLATGQFTKAYQLYPLVCAVGGGSAILSYLIGMGLLLVKSVRVSDKARPGFWFSLGWLLLFVEGQFVCAVLLGFFAPIRGAALALVGMVLAAVPLLLAAQTGFVGQPWGAPFLWPKRLPPARVIGQFFLGLGVLYALQIGYSKGIEWITHKPLPVQETVPLIKEAIASNPLIAIFSAVVVMPVVEEILFRGLFFGVLEKRLSAGWTIVITAAAFALFHLQLAFFLPIFLGGVVCGWARSKSGTLALPILLHVLNNAISVLMI